MKKRRSCSDRRAFAAAVAWAASISWACTSVHSLEEPRLRTPEPDEGVAVGSLLVTVSDPVPGQSFLTDGYETPTAFRVGFTEPSGEFDFSTQDFYRIGVRTGEEKYFVVPLPATVPYGRDYYLDTIEPRSWWVNLSAELAGTFHVRPGEVTYIGRIVIRLPPRIGRDRPFSIDVEDAEEEAREYLRQRLPALARALRSEFLRVSPSFEGHFWMKNPPPTPSVP